MRFALRVISFLLLTGCGPSPEVAPPPFQNIAGRDDYKTSHDMTRMDVYRVRVPEGWMRRDPSEYRSIEDSKLPLVEYFIRESADPNNEEEETAQISEKRTNSAKARKVTEDEIRITIHNFPVDHIQNRIPPAAQVQRWQRQLQGIDPAHIEQREITQGGFSGLFFKGQGNFEGKKAAILGWAMQIDVDHFRTLTYIEATPVEQRYYKQMRADYTIKATGPIEIIDKHQEEIEQFAQSFELIQSIPSK